MRWLIFGGKGWIGSYVTDILNKMGEDVIYPISRADDEEGVIQEIYQINPDRIISLVGRTSGPNFSTIDYLEQEGKLVENIRDNLYSPFVLAMVCQELGIHLTYMGTGCICTNKYVRHFGVS